MSSTQNPSSLLALALLLGIGAFTPGPNNFLVLRAARGGFARALPAMLGIVLGSLALLACALAGAGRAFAAYPPLRSVLAASGCAYLLWLAFAQLGGRKPPTPARAPHGALAAFAFQLVNPKAWSITFAAIATQPAQQPLGAFATLAPLYAGIALAGLALWARLGDLLARWQTTAAARWFDRAAAAALALCALALLP